MNSINLSNIISLPVEERIKLVELIWDSLTEFPENVPLTEEQKQELDKRLNRYLKNPNGNISWNDPKKKLNELFTEAIEEIGLMNAIKEGDKNDLVKEEVIMNYVTKKINRKKK